MKLSKFDNFQDDSHTGYVIQSWQTALANQFEQISDDYYEIVDELYEKLKDISYSSPLPDLEFTEFQFILDFEAGRISASDVVDKLEKIQNFDKLALNKLTKKLYKHIEKFDSEGTDFFKHSIQEIKDKVVQPYTRFLKGLFTMFKKMAIIDQNQVKLTWFLVDANDTTITKTVEDLTLNQTIRQMAIYCKTKDKFRLGTNILCFDNTWEDSSRTQTHYIFGPQSYISFLVKKFNIDIYLSSKEDMDYVKNLIEGYA